MNGKDKSFAQYVKLDLRMPVKVTLNDLIGILDDELDDEAMFILVAGADEAVCDWAFTKRCFEHFKRLMDEYEEEIKEPGTWVR